MQMANPPHIQPGHPREVQHAVQILATDQTRPARAPVRLAEQGPQHEAPTHGARVQADLAAEVAHELPDRQPLSVLVGGCAREPVVETRGARASLSRLRRSTPAARQLPGPNHGAVLPESAQHLEGSPGRAVHVLPTMLATARHRRGIHRQQAIRGAVHEAQDEL